MAVKRDFPVYVGLETLNTCNARCPFCPLFQGDQQLDRSIRPAHIMTAALFEQCVTEIASWAQKPQWIYLNMDGEPLSDPMFRERLAILKKFGLASLVDIQTNGQYLNKENAQAIIAAGVNRITLGFDGASKEVYEAHRVRCDYDRVLSNLKQFVALRNETSSQTYVAIQYVRTKKNEHEVLDAYKMFSEFLSERDVFQDNLAKDWSDKGDDSGIYYVSKINKGDVGGCQSFSDQMIIHSDGTLAGCCWDYNLGVSSGGFGNVTAGLLETWRGPKRSSVQASVLTEVTDSTPTKCLNCPSFYKDDLIDPAEDKLRGPLSNMAVSGFVYRFASPT